MPFYKGNKPNQNLKREAGFDVEEMSDQVSSNIMDDIQDSLSSPDQTSGVQAIKEIFNSENLMMKTELQPQEIHYYARLYIISKVLKLPEMKDFCDVELALKVSNMRKGRREAVEISRQQIEPPKSKGVFGLFG